MLLFTILYSSLLPPKVSYNAKEKKKLPGYINTMNILYKTELPKHKCKLTMKAEAFNIHFSEGDRLKKNKTKF